MKKKFHAPAALLSAVLGAAAAQAQSIPNNVTFRNYFGSMVFNRPVLFAQYPGEDSAHVVLQQNGRVITVRWQNSAWAKTDSALIPVTGGTSGGNEQGMLGFAFHPQFAANGKYYVSYITGSNPGVTLVAQRTAGLSRRPQTSDPQATVLRLAQPYSNHNGGTIAFGPLDGYLYIGLGDGGDGGDPQNRAQNNGVLFGKMLRVDVDGADAFPADTTKNYAVPAGNPFVGNGSYAPEIWALGLRNPWKWSFHPLTGQMWIGDVGQGSYEEISRAVAGNNLGWRLREGAFCYNPSTNCPSEGLTPPAKTMQRSHAASITGGAFFTGDPSSAYFNIYIFGDYANNHVWAMRPAGGTLADSVRIGQVFNVVSFDRDSRGRVFATSLSNTSSVGSNNGVVFLLESPDMRPAPTGIRSGSRGAARPIRLADLLRHPEAFTVRGLDGREIRGGFSGTAWVREKGSAEPPRLVTVVR